jgi:1-acyl-sn-glycerol-3-phosphate acyltransferase
VAARDADAAAARARDPFDPDWSRELHRDALGPMGHYFRPRIVNGERIPQRGPVILASNHSGNCLPYDAIMIDVALWERDGMVPARKIRTVFEKELALHWWLRPFGVDDIYRRGGGVDMSFDNFERLLADGERVLYFPEGVPGIGKGFQNRYRLQPFHTSFATLAMRRDVPVLPTYIVNAEWLMPFHFTLKPVDWVMQRVFRVPFLPIPLGLIACLWPWLWFSFVFPAHLTCVVGEPLDLRTIGRERGVRDPADPTREEAQRVATAVQSRMQAELSRHVAEYGRKPYGARDLWRHLRHAPDLWSRVLPTGWPLTFHRVDRRRGRPEARGRLRALLRDWDLLLYYLPLGWPLLSMVRWFRRPPAGYRGLTRREARAKRGEAVWKLRDAPLPPRRARYGDDA